MTVAELRERMTIAEYVYWYSYLGRKAQRQELEMKQAANQR